MRTIKVIIENKIARLAEEGCCIVCGNSDYFIEFEFDEEWSEYSVKTARFAFRDKIYDVVFEGNTVNVPILEKTKVVSVGVFAGDLITTTPVKIDCDLSILCAGGMPADPPPNVYNGIIEFVNERTNSLEEFVQTSTQRLEDMVMIVLGKFPTLLTPTITVDGNILTITDNNGVFATSYEVYQNDSIIGTVYGDSVDLETIALESGSLKVIARGDMFNNSEFSNSVDYTYNGLAYTLESEGNYYICNGKGNSTKTDLVIQPEIRGKKVTTIDNADWGSGKGRTITIPNTITKFGSGAGIADKFAKIYYTGTIKEWCEISFSVSAFWYSTTPEFYINGERIINLVIPEDVTLIKNGAFEQARFIKSITISESVEHIEPNAFGNCTKATSLIIKNGITKIGRFAFADCGFVRVEIPKSVTVLETYSFIRCGWLEDIYYSGTIAEWEAITKEKDWDLVIGNYTVHCTDGDIAKE